VYEKGLCVGGERETPDDVFFWRESLFAFGTAGTSAKTMYSECKQQKRFFFMCGKLRLSCRVI
jgi:hypothetical protein